MTPAISARSNPEPSLNSQKRSGTASRERFAVVVVSPHGYIHSKAFHEVAATIHYGLIRLGCDSILTASLDETDRRSIVLGAHMLSRFNFAPPRAGSILYNFEQMDPTSSWIHESYLSLLRDYTVWDYSEQNVRCLRQNGIQNVHHVPVGWVPEISHIVSAHQDIDVLFYGSMNDRRALVLEQLKSRNVRVETAFGVYGEDRDALIARARLVLNVHFYESKIFEIVRVSYLLANGACVVSENGPDPVEKQFSSAVAFAPYDQLADTCLRLLTDANARKQLAAQGRAFMQACPEDTYLETALEAEKKMSTSIAMTASSNGTKLLLTRPLPSLLNIGSGKAWNEDALNIDIDSEWYPDAIYDLNTPLPQEGAELVTTRFGTVRLTENHFDLITAFDVLEHVQQLCTAMSTCLAWLKEGGIFRINVPYDLSWGAWQDPTHVRAFNERSWLYYTDWYWYLGWTRWRFDLVSLQYMLSPIGQELHAKGTPVDHLIRMPRAVDSMLLDLRKRPLTQQEVEFTRSRRGARRSPVGYAALAPTLPTETKAHISEYGDDTDSSLISCLQNAFRRALAEEGNIDRDLLQIDGMSGRKYRFLINNLISSLPDARYLEIGTWAGSTLCSAINRNTVSAVAIDNWSEFGGPKDGFIANLQRFTTAQASVSFIESDFRKVDYMGLGRFNVYMFDGPHTAADQYDGIALVLPALEDEFILIVDDWNHNPAREGTLKAIESLGVSIRHSYEIRTTLDGSHPTLARQASEWHNGYFLAVISKIQKKAADRAGDKKQALEATITR